MFDNLHHQKIHRVLCSLNASIFEDAGAFFGGGTLITLLNGEYRWSKDIDFICPMGPGYKKIRGIVADSFHNPSVFFSDNQYLEFPRDMTANQYGVRFLVVVEGTPIKFEIVAEARIALDRAQWYKNIPVPCLGFDDQCTEKLLANTDRWLDPSVESRDLIDLSMLRTKSSISATAIEKAENAYSVMPSLKAALTKFQNDPDYREKCFSALAIENRPSIIDGVDLLARDFGFKLTQRTELEAIPAD